MGTFRAGVTAEAAGGRQCIAIGLALSAELRDESDGLYFLRSEAGDSGAEHARAWVFRLLPGLARARADRAQTPRGQHIRAVRRGIRRLLPARAPAQGSAARQILAGWIQRRRKLRRSRGAVRVARAHTRDPEIRR